MTTVLVSVGTDHHPFDRLIHGVQGWLSAHDGETRLIVQHGYSPPAPGVENFQFLSRDDLLDLFATADLVVTQVGPGTIFDANSVGRRPISMPRDPARGEHVDHHQYTFGAAMGRRDVIELVHSVEELHAALSAALLSPETTHLPPRRCEVAETAARLAAEAERLVAADRHPIYWRRIPASLRRGTEQAQGVGSADLHPSTRGER